MQPVIDTDPDVAYFRTRYSLLDPQQRRWLRDLARVSQFKATSDPPSWLTSDERAELTAFLEEDADVRRLDPYRYAIGDREVDFSALCRPTPDLLCEQPPPL